MNARAILKWLAKLVSSSWPYAETRISTTILTTVPIKSSTISSPLVCDESNLNYRSTCTWLKGPKCRKLYSLSNEKPLYYSSNG